MKDRELKEGKKKNKKKIEIKKYTKLSLCLTKHHT
jgi:hypothetical protein